ncbi:MAG TPA: DinB family protein [Candidatus Limnocylindrales bacterium]
MDDLIATSQALLATTPERWERLVEASTSELLRRAPAPGEWSALECLGHLVDTEEQAFPVRVEAFLAGRDFAAFDPDESGTRVGPETDGVVLARRFAEARRRSLALLRRIGQADLGRRARHPELGEVRLDELLHEWVGHDLMHTVQAERALLQPFIVGSGPWRGLFVAHDVEASATG